MLAGIRHKTILALGFVLFVVVIACSPSDNDAVPTAVAAPVAAPSSSQPSSCAGTAGTLPIFSKYLFG